MLPAKVRIPSNMEIRLIILGTREQNDDVGPLLGDPMNPMFLVLKDWTNAHDSVYVYTYLYSTMFLGEPGYLLESS